MGRCARTLKGDASAPVAGTMDGQEAGKVSRMNTNGHELIGDASRSGRWRHFASRIVFGRVFVLAAAVCFATGCKKEGAGGAPKMPPPQVVVAEARVERVVETLPRVANIQANEMVDVKSETDGVVQEILFEEGQAVEKGAVLVRLDETKLAATLVYRTVG